MTNTLITCPFVKLKCDHYDDKHGTLGVSRVQKETRMKKPTARGAKQAARTRTPPGQLNHHFPMVFLMFEWWFLGDIFLGITGLEKSAGTHRCQSWRTGTRAWGNMRQASASQKVVRTPRNLDSLRKSDAVNEWTYIYMHGWMHVSMHACMHVYVYVYVYVYVCIYTYNVYLYIYICVCICICICICVCVCVCVCICMYMYVYVCICMYVWVILNLNLLWIYGQPPFYNDDMLSPKKNAEKLIDFY
jgi:hypothetical protein